MGVSDWFKPKQHSDPVLGTLLRRGGYWRGEIELARERVPLALRGSDSSPGEAYVELARELPRRYAALQPAIERALFEHYEPYAEAVEDGAHEGVDLPRLADPGQVWEHVSLIRILIEPMDRIDTVEIAYHAAWDPEHTLGVRFQSWVLVELNGSVL